MSSKEKSKSVCRNCGGSLVGDGFTVPVSCEFANTDGVDPDAGPVYCPTANPPLDILSMLRADVAQQMVDELDKEICKPKNLGHLCLKLVLNEAATSRYVPGRIRRYVTRYQREYWITPPSLEPRRNGSVFTR